MFVEVLRPFTAERPLQTGEIVDASDWLHTERLMRMRYVKPTETTPAQPQKARKSARETT